MAKDSSGLINIALIGGAAYLAYTYFMAPSAPGVSTASDAAAVAAKAAADAAAIAASNADAATKAAAAKAAADAKAVADKAASDKAASDKAAADAAAATAATPKVGKYPYTDKASYQQALVNAVVDASGGDASLKQTADQWNWFMVNSVGVNYSPDPTNAMAPGQRFTPITAAVYYDALRYQNMLDYPSGIAGLSALTSSINRINRHPLAQSAPGNQFYLKPRRVVM